MSRPSLVIDEDNDWGELSPLPSTPSSRPLPPSTSLSSSKFNVFSNIGSVIAGRGGDAMFGF